MMVCKSPRREERRGCFPGASHGNCVCKPLAGSDARRDRYPFAPAVLLAVPIPAWAMRDNRGVANGGAGRSGKSAIVRDGRRASSKDTKHAIRAPRRRSTCATPTPGAKSPAAAQTPIMLAAYPSDSFLRSANWSGTTPRGSAKDGRGAPKPLSSGSAWGSKPY